MTTPTNLAGEPEPMTFAELRTALETVSPVYDPLRGRMMDPDHVRFDRIRELCERRSELFANALDLSHIQPLSSWEMLTMADDAVESGFITGSMFVDLMGCNARFYGRRAEDDIPVYLIVQASFEVKRGDVKRASAQAETLETILRHDGPPEETGIALPVVAGTRLRTDPNTGAVMVALWDTTYVEISNGNELTA